MSSCKLPQYPSEVPRLTFNKVKQFIRNVRSSKTIADERAVVQKESAAIRASFREESGDHNIRYNRRKSYWRAPVDLFSDATMSQSYYTSSRLENEHILGR